MKKLILIFSLLVSGICFAKGNKYSNEHYNELLRSKNYETVLEELGSVDENSSVEDCFYMGLTYFYMENDLEAQKYLKLATEKDDTFYDAFDFLAGSYYYNQQFEESLQNYEKCIALDKSASRPYKMLGDIYSTFGDLQTAYKNYEKFYKLKKDSESTYLMAYCLYEMGDLKKAKHYVEEYLKYDSESYSMLNIMILILYSTGDYKKVSKYEDQLRELWKNSDDEYITEKSYFYIYSFDYKDFEIDVYEKFDLSGYYYNQLVCNVVKDGKVVKSVNLEYDGITEELSGIAYFVGIDEIDTKTHYTTSFAFSEYPKFADFIKAVKIVLDDDSTWVASSYISTDE